MRQNPFGQLFNNNQFNVLREDDEGILYPPMQNGSTSHSTPQPEMEMQSLTREWAPDDGKHPHSNAINQNGVFAVDIKDTHHQHTHHQHKPKTNNVSKVAYHRQGDETETKQPTITCCDLKPLNTCLKSKITRAITAAVLATPNIVFTTVNGTWWQGGLAGLFNYSVNLKYATAPIMNMIKAFNTLDIIGILKTLWGANIAITFAKLFSEDLEQPWNGLVFALTFTVFWSTRSHGLLTPKDQFKREDALVWLSVILLTLPSTSLWKSQYLRGLDLKSIDRYELGETSGEKTFSIAMLVNAFLGSATHLFFYANAQRKIPKSLKRLMYDFKTAIQGGHEQTIKERLIAVGRFLFAVGLPPVSCLATVGTYNKMMDHINSGGMSELGITEDSASVLKEMLAQSARIAAAGVNYSAVLDLPDVMRDESSVESDERIDYYSPGM